MDDIGWYRTSGLLYERCGNVRFCYSKISLSPELSKSLRLPVLIVALPEWLANWQKKLINKQISQLSSQPTLWNRVVWEAYSRCSSHWSLCATASCDCGAFHYTVLWGEYQTVRKHILEDSYFSLQGLLTEGLSKAIRIHHMGVKLGLSH
jgi:hypothetical protein